MAKLEVRENYRLEVVPNFWLSKNHKDYYEALQSAKAAILRHVDDIESCEAEWDTVYKCTLCDSTWEDMPYTGCPECCSAAGEEWATAEGGTLCNECDGAGLFQDDIVRHCAKCDSKGYVRA